MAKVSIAGLGTHLGSVHAVTGIFNLNDFLRIHRFEEAGPSRSDVEFGFLRYKGFNGNNVHVDTRFFVIPVFIVERRLSAALAGNSVLGFREAFAEVFVGF